jgi:hypothetical protein
VQDVPALQVVPYAMLSLAIAQASTASAGAETLPLPKWAPSGTPSRQSTQQGISQLRGEVWGRALGLMNFSDLALCAPSAASPEKLLSHLPSAILYAKN